MLSSLIFLLYAAGTWGAFLPEDFQMVLNKSIECTPESGTLDLPRFFQPPMDYQTYDDGLDFPAAFVNSSLQVTALAIVQDRLGLPDGQVAYMSGYTSDTAEYAYFTQVHDNIRFVNAVAHLVLKDNKIVAFGSSFVNAENIAPSFARIDVSEAIPAAELVFKGEHNGHPAKIEYFAKEDGSIALVHVIQVQNDVDATWYEVYVDAHSGKVVGSVNFMAEAGYTAVPIHKESILQGSEYLLNPQDRKASPLGWHQTTKKQKAKSFTSGNNVISYIGQLSKVARQSKGGQVFQYRYQTERGPKNGQNPNAARVNAFYVINKVHDFTYRYGFTEKAFNFQVNNFGKGGKGNDPVHISVQDANGKNNADFATPPDGQPGRCRMFLWNTAKPERDGSMDNSILVHEMTHGITNRMTGGGSGRCLSQPESGAMGEGWSDAMALWTEFTSQKVPNMVVGKYATNKGGGIRQYRYSVNPQTNPLKYANLNKIDPRFVHPRGEIWANTLHNVYAALVKKHGFSKDAMTNPGGKEGNVAYLHLFLDALAIQPCNPTFLHARSAWIQADKNRYKGRNRCLLWKVFASKGMGTNAKGKGPKSYRNGHGVPASCKKRRKETLGEDDFDDEFGIEEDLVFDEVDAFEDDMPVDISI